MCRLELREACHKHVKHLRSGTWLALWFANMQVTANSIAIEAEDSADGASGKPVVLLVMGLGMQLVAWPAGFVQALVDAGYRVIRFDNRDIGRSQHFDHLGAPNLIWATLLQRLGFAPKSPYTTQDMANDALGVLDALKVQRAHVVGVSLGGMIAQRMALSAPERVQTLTSIMSSSGARGLPAPSSAVQRALMRRPKSLALEDIVDNSVQLFKVIASPAFRQSDDELRARARLAVERSYHPQGTMRQLAAIIADTTRAEALGRVKAPTLVLHGRDDLLSPFACGEDTARRIVGSRFVGVDGMGHDLAPGVVSKLLESLLPFLAEHAMEPNRPA